MESTLKDILNNDELLFKAFSDFPSLRLREISLRLQTLAAHKEEDERHEKQRAALQDIADAIDDYANNYGSFSIKIVVPNGRGAYERYGFEIHDAGEARDIGFNGLTIDCAGMGGKE